ncbi:phage tail assembly chaperone [Brucella endophytica]|uniref:phage tail assembly chaperone n=1 Tax=Brucella endophytica TaxID=1963359 RepID=UPI004041DB15
MPGARRTGKKLQEVARWQIEWGDRAESLIERHEERGETIPENLYCPPILAGYEEWISAFWELSTERQIGFAAGPIPGSAISRRCEEMGIVDLDEIASFRGAIRAMDRVILADLSDSHQSSGGIRSKPHVSSRPMTFDLFDAMFEQK